MDENVQDELWEDRLISGEELLCPECKNGILVPYNTTADKAHCFNCTKCDFFVHLDFGVNIE
ncbi:MAG: hypothetical protein ACI4XP_01310 [Acutalibacteraceae bacterium]